MVPPESTITSPEHLAGQEIAVGYHSGSHFTTIQSLEAFLSKEQIKLRFGGSVWARVDVGIGRDLPAVSVWGLSFQVLEQLGFRKIVDASFMIAFMFPPGVDPGDVEKYMNGLKRAQMDLDIAPEQYRHYYLNEIPDRYKSMVDVRRFSPGSALCFCHTPRKCTPGPRLGSTSAAFSKGNGQTWITRHRSPHRARTAALPPRWHNMRHGIYCQASSSEKGVSSHERD